VDGSGGGSARDHHERSAHWRILRTVCGTLIPRRVATTGPHGCAAANAGLGSGSFITSSVLHMAVHADRPAERARVLVVAPQPFFELRGTPLNVLAMLRTLCAAGHEVHLATFGLGETVPIDGLTYHRAPALPFARTVPIGFSARKVAHDAALAVLVAGLIATRRFDVVHAVEEALFFALPLARARNIPVIADVDSSLSDQLAYGGTIRAAAALRAARAVERMALRRSRLAITVCRSLTEMVAERAPALPVAQIEDCAPEGSERPPDPARLEELRREWNPDGAPLAVYTGNLAAYQGIALLFDALPVLAARLPPARLLVVGGSAEEIGAARASLGARGLAHLVRFAGRQPADRMAEFMALGDVLVSPRLHGDNTPLKIYAYMASGRPIVATDAFTHTQVLDERTALLCAPSPEGLGTALATVLADPIAFAGRGGAARARRTRFLAGGFLAQAARRLRLRARARHAVEHREQHVAAGPRQERVERGEGAERGMEHPERASSLPRAAEHHHPLRRRSRAAAGAAQIRPVERGVERVGEEARVRAHGPEPQRRWKEHGERCRGVAGVAVAVPRVREAERLAQGAQQGARLRVWHVEHDAAAGPRAPRELGEEAPVVLEVLEQIDHDHEIERGGLEGERGVPGEAHDALADHGADRAGGLVGEIGARPAPALAPEEEADHAVVGAEVERVHVAHVAGGAPELAPLGLLEHRRAEQGELPLPEGVVRHRGAHGRPAPPAWHSG
jgi:glycosyltransferase involved in cell wall biosynthesis